MVFKLLSKVVAVAVLFSVSTMAGPVNEVEVARSVDDTKDGNVFFCTGPNFTGTCQVIGIINNFQCTNFLGSLGVFNDNAGSFGPDECLVCELFDQINCSTFQVPPIQGVRNPGIAVLANSGGFNTVMSSFSCFFEC